MCAASNGGQQRRSARMGVASSTLALLWSGTTDAFVNSLLIMFRDILARRSVFSFRLTILQLNCRSIVAVALLELPSSPGSST